MKAHTRYTILNAAIVTVALISATLFFLAQLRNHAVQDAGSAQQERLRAFWTLLKQKGSHFAVKNGKLFVDDYQLSGNNELPDQVKEIFGGTATIFQGDVRVATNVLTPDGKRATGTRLVGPAFDALFQKGTFYRGEAPILGTDYFTAYDPIKDDRGQVIGALYVGIKKSEFFQLYDDIKTKVVVGGGMLNLLFLGFALLNLRSRREADRALELRDRKMKAILNSIPDMAWIKDQEGRFVAVNEPFGQACGHSPDSLVGKSDLDIWPPELAQVYRAGDREVMESGTSMRVEEQLVGSDGMPRWIETIKNPFFNAQGEIAGSTGIARDVTERHQAEEELRFTRYSVEHTRDGVAWVDEEGRILFANESLCRIFAVSPAEVPTLTVFKLVPQYTPEHWSERWRHLERDGSQIVELMAQAGDGHSVPIEVSSNFLVHQGRGRICSFIRDISERKRLEEKNKEALSLLSATLESIADGIVVLDLNGGVVLHNRKYPLTVGLPDEVMAERNYQSMLACVLNQLKDPELFRKRLAEQMAHPERESTLVMEFVDGRIVERVSTPYLVGDRLSGVVLNMRDITAQHRVETHLRNAQKVEALGTLTGGIAHDFNNRLTAIIGYGTLVRDQADLSEEARRYLDLLLTSADRAAELTQGLLAYSRKQPHNPAPLRLNELVAGVTKFLPPILGKGITLSLEMPQVSPVVHADRGQMEQVLFNLVGNARDAMDGRGRLTIAVGSAQVDAAFVAAQGYGLEGDYAILSVTDTGTGMDAVTLEKVFEPFFTTKDVGKGTGLGLSIVYGIVKQHDGFINVVSEPGSGTTFWVYLPLTHERVVEAHRDGVRVRLGAGETILLVEDDAEVRSLFREVLVRNGYQVIEAVDGADGVRKFRERGACIDLLFLDVIMPLKNGWEAFTEIRKLRGDVKVLFMSGYTRDIINKAGLENQGLHLMSKPIQPAALLRKIRELLD
ncbi:PAS domain S-box protein [Geomonas agri]|uniref:PAS domain S-box protein n=1 Tax=Geomonas agri TaxID=2873702 RepID=UPI001CD49F98|nr:PAS domain S-box protein [Geomonas agri]